MDIGLGTVQLGLPYGNSRDAPVMPEEETRAILEHALSAGIRFFDTAPAYGESERRLGRFGLASRSVEISTKIPAVPESVWRDRRNYETFARASLADSAARLGVLRLGLVQFHQCDVRFLADPGVRHVMRQLLADDTCDAIGISVYDLEQARAALDCDAVSALQVPINIVDTRFAEPAFVQHCRERRVRLIARSVLLQGVLVPSAALPAVRRASELAVLRDAASAAAVTLGRPLHALALAYVSHLDWLSVALLGPDSLASLRENLALLQPRPAPLTAADDAAFAAARALAARGHLFDPSTWDAA